MIQPIETSETFETSGDGSFGGADLYGITQNWLARFTQQRPYFTQRPGRSSNHHHARSGVSNRQRGRTPQTGCAANDDNGLT